MKTMFFASLAFAGVAHAEGANWKTAYCYTPDVNAQPIVYLGEPVASSTNPATGTRPVILMVNIPSGENTMNVSGEAQSGYYDAAWKTNTTRNKTVVNMSATFSGATEPNTGTFMELSIPVLAAAPQTKQTVAAVLTFRVGEDAEGFEGTSIGAANLSCDLR